MTDVSDEYLLELWRSPQFFGSYSGVKTFQSCLKLEKNITVSQERLYKILKKDSLFIIHQKSPSNIKRRHLILNNYGEVVFGDLSYMYNYNDYKYFFMFVLTRL